MSLPTKSSSNSHMTTFTVPKRPFREWSIELDVIVSSGTVLQTLRRRLELGRIYEPSALGSYYWNEVKTRGLERVQEE